MKDDEKRPQPAAYDALHAVRKLSIWISEGVARRTVDEESQMKSESGDIRYGADGGST
jgi:hypothetical protein